MLLTFKGSPLPRLEAHHACTPVFHLRPRLPPPWKDTSAITHSHHTQNDRRTAPFRCRSHPGQLGRCRRRTPLRPRRLTSPRMDSFKSLCSRKVATTPSPTTHILRSHHTMGGQEPRSQRCDRRFRRDRSCQHRHLRSESQGQQEEKS